MYFYQIFIVALLCSIAAADNEGEITLSDGTLIVRMDKVDVYDPYFCQGCFEFYLVEDKDEIYEFRWATTSVVELAAPNTSCCMQSITKCPWSSSNCNQHGIRDLPPRLDYVIINDGTGLQYSGNLGTYNQDCTPPGIGNEVCASFVYTHSLITEDTLVDLGGGAVVNVSAHSVKSVVSISNWPFNATSWGLRIKLLIGASDTILLAMRLFPANTPAEDGVIYSDFDEIGIDTYTRQARVQFPHVATIGGMAGVNIPITGPYAHEFDPYMKYVYIDLPRSNQMEYTVFTRILSDDLSSDGFTPIPSAWAIPLVAIPLAVN